MTTKVAFTLPAEAVEGASEAILLGDFNNWNSEKAPRLERQPDGSFKAIAQLEEGHTYHYRFLLNDGRWVNDYNAQGYVSIPGLHVDNCIITVPVPEAKEETHAKAKSAKATAIKKAAPKKAPGTDTLKVKKTKAVVEKGENKKVEKSEQAAKKAAPKAKK